MASSSQRNTPLPGTLTRTQLTLALIFITLLPFCLVVVLYTTLPRGSDPQLLALVSIAPRAWPSESASDARLVPSVVVENPTEQTWTNVNMSINEQFHFYHPDPIEPGEEIVVPLKFFHTKGNQYYPPESQPLRLLTVYAQIPSGARAILEVEGEKLRP